MALPVSHTYVRPSARPVSLAFGAMPLAGAIAVLLAGGAIGAALDTAQGSPAKELFAVLLSAAAVLATWTVRRRQLGLTVAMVPLAYLLLLLLGTAAAHETSFAADLAYAFIVKAPVVLIATAVAAVAALTRRVARG